MSKTQCHHADKAYWGVEGSDDSLGGSGLSDGSSISIPSIESPPASAESDPEEWLEPECK